MADLPHELPEGAEGAAVLPLIPDELGIHPLLLAVMHCVIFFDSSDEAAVHDAAAEESLQYIALYLQRLKGRELQRVREDLDCLIGYAREQRWPDDVVNFLENFLEAYGVGAA